MPHPSAQPAADALRETLCRQQREAMTQHVTTARAEAQAWRAGANGEWESAPRRHRPALEAHVRTRLGGGLNPLPSVGTA